jgi:hypothetical protein
VPSTTIVQGYLADKKTPSPVGLCLGPYGGPRGWASSHGRGNPVRIGLLHGPGGGAAPHGEKAISLPNNQRQHCTLNIQKDVLPYALC